MGMSAEGAQVLAQGIATTGDIFGGILTNVAQRRAANRAMKFSERMASTQHQREVADLQAAGLNPLLTVSGGSGASAPQGIQPQYHNPAADLGDRVGRMIEAVQSVRASKQTQQATYVNTMEQINRALDLMSRLDVNSATAERERSQTMLNAATTDRILEEVRTQVERTGLTSAEKQKVSEEIFRMRKQNEPYRSPAGSGIVWTEKITEILSKLMPTIFMPVSTKKFTK